MLNIVLLVTCICTVIAIILYLFFWNRIVAYVLGFALRLSFWNQGESSIWLEIGSVHFSILGGSVLFKDLRYHSSNQTIKVVKGQVCWRYWLRKPAGEEDLSHARVVGEDTYLKERPSLSCRIQVSVQGMEWFIYNRTAAYDYIVSQIDPEMIPTPVPTPYRTSTEGRPSMGKVTSRASAQHENSVLGPSISLVSSIYKKTPARFRQACQWLKRQLPTLDPKELLPVGLEATKAAIVIGNASTASLLVAEFQRGEGTFGIVQARSKYDLYKQMLNFRFQNASASYVANPDYDSHMSDVGRKVSQRITDPRAFRHHSYLSFSSFRKLWNRLKLWSAVSSAHPHKHSLFPHPSVPLPHPPTWGRRKLQKALEDETPVGVDYTRLEYAIERRILEAPVLELLYYADVVGIVPAAPLPTLDQPETLDPFDIGNGDLPPEWGIDIVIHDGVLRYGPWADRQRVELQRTFFPQTFHDTEPTPRLSPGDLRMWTGLKVFIELRNGTTLQIPFRESSKNWQWDGEVQVPNRPRKREPASIHIRAGDSSTISYIMPVVASATGYEPSLEVHLDTVTVTSTLNDIRLVTAETCRLRCHLPSPLKWNAERQWVFSIQLRQPALYLLRDHINMFTDLGKDWSSGPPSPYHRFIPMIYAVEFDMHQYELNFYVNDHNIIDKPLLKEENALLTLRGHNITSRVRMPFTKYRPEFAEVSFGVEAPNVAVSLTLPAWSTYRLHPTPDRSELGTIGLLRVDGSYLYFAEVRPENIDRLRLNFQARELMYRMFGWSVRHFMVFRDNYFGSFTHFSTLNEYLDKRRKGQSVGDPTELTYRPGRSNGLEVEVTFSVDRGAIVLPAGLPGYESFNVNKAEPSVIDLGSSVVLNIPDLQLQLRTNDYYMEMSLNVDVITGYIEDHCPVKDYPTFFAGPKNVNEILVVDGLDVIANRLFGVQPQTATYVCIWEIQLDQVKTLLSAHEARIFSAASAAFGLNFSDPLNAPAEEYALPTSPDVTFLKFKLNRLDVVWSTGNAALNLSLPDGIQIDRNDLAGTFYQKVTSIRLPIASIKALLASPKVPNCWCEVAEVTCDAMLDMYASPAGWRERARIQREFIVAQDEPTQRAAILYSQDGRLNDAHLPSGRGAILNDIYLPQLRIPKVPKSTHRSDHGVRQRSAGLHNRPLPTQFEQPSDSEGEVLPQADFNDRVAKGRPTSSVQRHGDENLSSGDESDDDEDDESESHDWSSDTSEEGDETHEDDIRALMMRYSTFMRRFTVRHLNRPTLWDTSPFTPIQSGDPRAWWSPDALLTEEMGSSSSSVPPLEPMPLTSDESNSSVVRCHCKKGLTLWITPLVLPVVEEVFKDITAKQLSPELRFDALMNKLLQSTYFRPHSAEKATIYDIHLSSVCLRTVQLVKPLHVDTELRNRHELQVPLVHLRNPPGSITSVVCRLDAFHFRSLVDQSSQDFSRRSFVSAFRSCMLLVKASQDLKVSREPHLDPCHVVIGSSQVSLSETTASLSVGMVSTKLGQLAPHFILASLHVLLRCARGLLAANTRAMNLTPALDQEIAALVLKYSRQKPSIDPLSTIQPSYLVQTGKPDRLRKNGIFKFLVNLRNSLRSLEDDERRAVAESKPGLDPSLALQEIIAVVESQYTGLGAEDDSSTISYQSLLHELFPEQVSTTRANSTKTDIPFDALVINLQGADLILSHSTSESQTLVLLRSLAATMQSNSSNLQPLAANTAKNRSNGSILRKNAPDLRRIILSVSVDESSITMHPQVLHFVHSTLLSVDRHSSLPPTGAKTPTGDVRGAFGSLFDRFSSMLYFEVMLSMRLLRLAAATDKLRVVYTVSKLVYASTSLLNFSAIERDAWVISMNHSLTSDEVTLEAISSFDDEKRNESPALASLIVTGGRINFVLAQEPRTRMTVRAVWGLEDTHLKVPRSALRLYRLIEEMMIEYSTIWKQAPQKSVSPPSSESSELPPLASEKPQHPLPSMQMQGSFGRLQVSLQVMPGTWLTWRLEKTIIFLTSSATSGLPHLHTFGLQIGHHTLDIISKLQSEGATSVARVKLHLPTFSLRGRFDGTSIEGLVMVDFFRVTVKPSDWDTLLSVQQKSGQDVNDLVHFIEETRQKRAHPTDPTEPRKKRVKLSGAFRIKGFCIGLDGLSSTLFLECDDIGGSLTDDRHLSWHIKLSDLSLSLASHKMPQTAFDRNRRSAFVIIDLEGRMGSRPDSSPDHELAYLEMTVTKVHAIMQPSSIGELGDFVAHLQGEVLIRKDERANRLAEFKVKTRSIMRSLDVKMGEGQQDGISWFDKYTIALAIRNIGVAFPLAFDETVQLPRSGSRDDTTVRAFLFSIRSLVFGAQRGESGQAVMKGFAFQFVSRFRQSMPSDFSGDNHETQNRLLYPEMTAQIRSERTSNFRRLRIKADVSGFILDVDSTIPDHVSSLIDVYRQGKRRVEQLASIPRHTAVPDAGLNGSARSGKAQSHATSASNILASLTFASGQVRMHSKESARNARRSRSISIMTRDSTGPGIFEAAEVFNLPVVSVWGEYRSSAITPRCDASGNEDEPSALFFKSTIHSSQNTLKPTLLPFLTELVDRIEDYMRKSTWRAPQASTTVQEYIPMISGSADGIPSTVVEPVNSMRITLSLRIDQSKLELTCQPDVNVIAGLHWDSGGFIVNISPGARKMALTGIVGGLTVGLKHGFLSEDCARLDARNLTFSMAFARPPSRENPATGAISVVLDTEFSGAIRFSRLQDVLCFKAVWLDRIPVFRAQGNTPATEVPRTPNKTPSSANPPTRHELTTCIIFRLRDIKLDVDLGQSISNVQLHFTDVVMRTRITEILYELGLSVAEFSLLASGNVSGRAYVPDFRFRTIRRNERISISTAGDRMLDLVMTTGALNISLESEYHRLLQYRAEPLAVTIYDDWSQISPQRPAADQCLRVFFAVSGTEVLAVMNVGTIPRLVSYVNKFRANLEAQREGASRESKAFRITRSPQPDNPLSAVADAMFKSARNRLKETDSRFSYTIKQQMSLKLEVLRLVVFPRAMRDPELAHFIGHNVHARLERLIEPNLSTSKRDLQLSFSSVTISKMSHLNHNLVMKENSLDSKEWLLLLLKNVAEATIFGLPCMDMQMDSVEEPKENHRVLHYKFSSRFIREGIKDAEDIYISLNMSLYSWLTVLRKTFAREMAQAQASSDIRMSSNILGQSMSALRRRTETSPPPPDRGTRTEPTTSQRSPKATVSQNSGRSAAYSSPEGANSSTMQPASQGLSTVSPTSPSMVSSADPPAPLPTSAAQARGLAYDPIERRIERLTMRQLGEATPDVMHPFFMKTAGFNLEDSLPQYVHEYATMPIEAMMKALLNLYSKQLRVDHITDIA